MRLGSEREAKSVLDVSIHAPRAGCDLNAGFNPLKELQFQFTHPVRGATRHPPKGRIFAAVSIHAPRAGCDELLPLDERAVLKFQFTHPVRGATEVGVLTRRLPCVSIHAPRAGCDSLKR